MKEICLELIKTTKERFKYPIISIYLIVLILWNWDVLSYYFLSTAVIEEKIITIKENYNNTWERIICPMIKAIVLAVLIPFIMWGIEALLFIINRGRRKIRNKNNEAIRIEKLAVAVNEFAIEEARTGKKSIEEWEEKLIESENRIEIERNSKNDNKIFYEQKILDQQELIDKLNDNLKDLNQKITKDNYLINIINGITQLASCSQREIFDVLNNLYPKSEFEKSVLNGVEEEVIEQFDEKEKIIYDYLYKYDLLKKDDYSIKLTILGMDIYNYLFNKSLRTR